MSEEDAADSHCVNGSQAAIEEITGQKEQALISILQQATGLGKTYGAVRAIVKRAVFDQQITIYLTPLRKDRDEVCQSCRELLAKLGQDPDDFLVDVLSEQDQVKEYFNTQVFANAGETAGNWQTRRRLYEEWRAENLPKSFPKTGKVFAALQSVLVFPDFQSTEEKTEASKKFSQIKWMIHDDASRLVDLEDDKRQKKLDANARKQRMRQLVFESLPWYRLMFPDYDLANKKIIVMTADKFLFPYKSFEGKSQCYWHLNFNRKIPGSQDLAPVNLVLDEADKIHQIWLSQMLNQPDYRIDLYYLARKIRDALDPKKSEPNPKIKQAGDNKARIDFWHKQFAELSRKYHLEDDLVVGSSLKEDQIEKQFLINEGEANYLSINDRLQVEYKSDPFSIGQAKKQRVNVIEKADSTRKHKQKAVELDKMLADLNQKIAGFVENSYSMGKNVQKHIKEIDDHQQKLGKEPYREPMELDDEQRFVLRSLLKTSDNDRLINYLISTYTPDFPPRHQTGIKANFTSDDSVFAKGFIIHAINSNRAKRTDVKVFRYGDRLTPELLLAILASKWRVILVSATAETDSIFSNFGLEWVYDNVPRVYQLPEQVERQLNAENEARNQAQRSKGKIAVQWVGLPDGANLRDVFKAALKDASLTNPQAADLIASMPGAPNGGRFDFNCPYRPEANEPLGNGQQISDVCYFFGRNLKLLQALAAFCKEHQAHPSRVAFIAYTNRSLKEEEAAWYEQTLKDLGYLTQEQVLVRVSAQGDAEKQLQGIKEAWAKGKLKIVLTSYSTMSRAVNPQFPAKDLLKKYPDDYVILDERFYDQEQPMVDINGCYMELPTHVLPAISTDRGQEASEAEQVMNFLEMHYDCDALLTLGTPDFTYADAQRLLEASYNRHPLKREANAFNRIQAKCRAYTSQIDQTSGRMVRTVVKPKKMLVILDEDITDYLDQQQIADKRTNAVMEAIAASAPKRPALPDQTAEHKLKRRMVLANNAMTYLVQDARGLVSRPEAMQKLWVSLRTFIAKHPWLAEWPQVEDPNLAKLLGNYYWDFGHPVSGFYFCEDKDWTRMLALGEDRNEVKQQMRKAKLVQRHKLRYLDYPGYLQRFAKIFQRYPWLKQQLEEKDYQLDFAPSRYLLIPGAFNNLYKGALGEAIGEAVLKQAGLDYHGMDQLPKDELERFDGFIKKADGQYVYVDWKNYDTRLSTSSETQTLRWIKKKLGMVKHGNSAIIINILQWSKSRLHPVSIVGPIEDGKVYCYPYLFDADGKLNMKLIEELRGAFTHEK